MRTLGLDIGGANLKAATSDGQAASTAFPLWQHPARLAEELGSLLDRLPAGDLLAVTMTGELADCFRTKAQGVAAILSAVEEVAAGRPVVTWQTGAEFVSTEVASEIPRLVAAANWHALATFVGRLVPSGSALLLDIGSTTTDLIPLLEGVPVPRGLTDRERLVHGELLYTGVTRTPVSAVVREVSLPEGLCPVAAELFATTRDVYLLTGDLPETNSETGSETEAPTADGRPATRAAAADRLARMICCDRSELTDEELAGIAAEVAGAQLQQLATAIDRVLARQPDDCGHVLLSGSGSFLARRIVETHPLLAAAEVSELAECFSEAVAEAACAYAVARLASERDGHLLIE